MKLRTVLAGATALASLTGVAQAAPNRDWYVGFEAGVNWLDTIDQVEHISVTPVINISQGVHFDSGWGVYGTVGRGLGGNWRIEAEIGYRENEVSRFTGTHGTNIPIDGSNSEFTLMANVLYDIVLGERCSLSLGAGIGADEGHTTSAFFDDTAWSFAYQGIIGLNYDIGETSELFVNFRYLGVDGYDYADSSHPLISLTQDDITKESLTVGIRFALGRSGS